MRSNHSGGFTLIEVLLSGLILFVTIASMTSVYRGAILASEKSENSLDMSAAMHAVRRVVTDNFRYGDFLGEPGGQGSHGEIDYRLFQNYDYVPTVIKCLKNSLFFKITGA